MSQTQPIATVEDLPRRSGRPTNEEIEKRRSEITQAKPYKQTTVHHMLRNLVAIPNPGDPGQVSAQQADSLVENWLAKGYNLHFTHLVGTANGGPILLWIFVR